MSAAFYSYVYSKRHLFHHVAGIVDIAWYEACLRAYSNCFSFSAWKCAPMTKELQKSKYVRDCRNVLALVLGCSTIPHTLPVDVCRNSFAFLYLIFILLFSQVMWFPLPCPKAPPYPRNTPPQFGQGGYLPHSYICFFAVPLHIGNSSPDCCSLTMKENIGWVLFVCLPGCSFVFFLVEPASEEIILRIWWRISQSKVWVGIRVQTHNI